MFIYLLMLILFSAYADSAKKKTPLEMIYENRCHVLSLDKLRNFSGQSLDATPVNKVFRCVSAKGNTKIEELIDSSYSCWKKNEEYVLGEFIEFYAYKANLFRKFRYYIDDSITIAILISFLDYPDYRKLPPRLIPVYIGGGDNYSRGDPPHWVRDALHKLTYNVYFNSLEKQSAEIRDRLSRCSEPEIEKLKLLVLCNLPAEVKQHKRDSLNNAKRFFDSSYKALVNFVDSASREFKLSLNKSGIDENQKWELFKKFGDSLDRAIKLDENLGLYKKELDNIEIRIPLWVKARLGDTIAEKEILLGFRNKDGSNLKRYAEDAIFVWSEPCKKAFLNLFTKDAPICNHRDETKYVRCRSLQDSLLLYLARRHPDDPMFGYFLFDSRHNADFCKLEEQAKYFTEFAKWAKKTYNIEINYNGFKPYFIKDMSKDNAGIRDFCTD